MLHLYTLLETMRSRRNETGATATEYGLLVGLIALIIVVGVGLFGDALNTFFNDLGGTVGSWVTVPQLKPWPAAERSSSRRPATVICRAIRAHHRSLPEDP